MYFKSLKIIYIYMVISIFYTAASSKLNKFQYLLNLWHGLFAILNLIAILISKSEPSWLSWRRCSNGEYFQRLCLPLFYSTWRLRCPVTLSPADSMNAIERTRLIDMRILKTQLFVEKEKRIAVYYHDVPRNW